MAATGFSLIELIVTMAIAALLCGLALPSFTALIAAERATQRINAMAGAVQLARTIAITHQTTTTICPGVIDACLGANRWHEGTLVFADRNANRRVDAEDFVAAKLPKLLPGERFIWRSFRNRSYLQFTARGYSDWQNGHLQYCPPDGNPRFARQIILNAQGRIRRAPDRDGDGIQEDARGRPLSC